jgi:hypothetical protein
MEDRPGCYGNLMAADTTLVQISRGYSPVRSSATLRANKALWPTSFKEPFVTTTLALKLFLEDEPAHLSILWSVFSSAHAVQGKILGELSQ